MGGDGAACTASCGAKNIPSASYYDRLATSPKHAGMYSRGVQRRTPLASKYQTDREMEQMTRYAKQLQNAVAPYHSPRQADEASQRRSPTSVARRSPLRQQRWSPQETPQRSPLRGKVLPRSHPDGGGVSAAGYSEARITAMITWARAQQQRLETFITKLECQDQKHTSAMQDDVLLLQAEQLELEASLFAMDEISARPTRVCTSTKLQASFTDERLFAVRQRLRAASYFFGGQDWKRLFEECDVDRSGYLDREEFHKAIRKAARQSSVAVSETQLE
eukprot:SAG31_NODE_2927_length_4900_cov_42.568314_4_plen_277_part_00